MTLDWDGKIRMDPSSRVRHGTPHRAALAVRPGAGQRCRCRSLRRGDASRLGCSTPTTTSRQRPPTSSVEPATGPAGAAIGKTLVSSSMQDRIAASLGRRLYEVPVGFKWFVEGLLDGSVAFGGEESAGMSFLRRDGRPWSTDKDGIIACLLAAEMTATTGRDPGETYAALTERFGAPVYRRIDAPATPEQKAALGELSPDAVTATELAGRAHHGQAHRGTRQRCRHRRAQGRHRAGLVRGASIGHGERDQAVRRVVRGRGTPGAHHRGGEGHRGVGPGELMPHRLDGEPGARPGPSAGQPAATSSRSRGSRSMVSRSNGAGRSTMRWVKPSSR